MVSFLQDMYMGVCGVYHAYKEIDVTGSSAAGKAKVSLQPGWDEGPDNQMRGALGAWLPSTRQDVLVMIWLPEEKAKPQPHCRGIMFDS